jgi:cell wall-associated NlpC family hydrolase
MTTLSAAQVAALVKQAGFPTNDQATMVAICRAESGYRVDAIGGPNSNGTYDYGLFQINSVHGYDTRKLTSDAAYNTQAAKKIYDGQGLRAWAVYNSGKYQQYMNEARQGVAQAANVNGNPSLPGSSGGGTNTTSQPSVTYGPNGPEITSAGIGSPLQAAGETNSPLHGLRIFGTEIGGDFADVIIGNPTYQAGIETVPNLVFTIADPGGDLLWRLRNIWVQGALVQYLDIVLRIDTIKFEPGTHTTGQLTLSCVDDIVYRLMQLTGSRTAEGISATQWIYQELQLAGLNPDISFLGESVPTQSVISRDSNDQSGQAGQGQKPSSWTTITRLGKELGKRVFVTGGRLVFGSSQFAMRWTAPGPLRLAWQALEPPEKWLTLPTASGASIGDRANVLQVDGKVPLNRAAFFRPGVPVAVFDTPAVVGDEGKLLMVEKVSYDLGTDTDGADITLLEPVDPPAQPPTQNSAGTNGGSTSSGTSTSGGGVDGQVARIVALALQQAGKRYVYGAQAPASDPNPSAFDCSMLVQWCCERNGINDCPRTSEAQQDWCSRNGTLISPNDAIHVKGALLFQPGHVAISLGNGSTIEAMNESQGVRQGNAAGRGWTAAGRIPHAQGY